MDFWHFVGWWWEHLVLDGIGVVQEGYSVLPLTKGFGAVNK